MATAATGKAHAGWGGANAPGAGSQCYPLFAGHEHLDELADCMDRIDQKFGHHTLYLGAMWGAEQTAPTRISFDQIPGLDEF